MHFSAHVLEHQVLRETSLNGLHMLSTPSRNVHPVESQLNGD